MRPEKFNLLLIFPYQRACFSSREHKQPRGASFCRSSSFIQQTHTHHVERAALAFAAKRVWKAAGSHAEKRHSKKRSAALQRRLLLFLHF
jgi:hypothetical protein